MSRIVGVGCAVLASAGVWLNAVPAGAGPNTDVIAAAGSDTTQDVMAKILQTDGTAGKTFNILAGNNQNTPLTVPSDSFCNQHTYHNISATSWPASGTPNQAAGEIAAPSGSTDGKNALTASINAAVPFNNTDNPSSPNKEAPPNGCIDIARSSSARSGSNPATYEYYAFAQDVLTWGSTSLNAPAALTQSQLQGIYNCTFTNWSQVGGNPGPIQRILPQNGSGTLNSFLSQVLGVSAITALPSGVAGCPNIEQIQESQYYDLFHGSSVYGPLGDATQYANAIGPMSMGKWAFEAAHDSNPTLDVRAGFRPGALIVQQGTDGNNPVYGVLWTGSQWLLNTASVVGTPTTSPRSENLTTVASGNTNQVTLVPQTHTVSSVSTTNNTFTVTAAPGSFTQNDVNGAISGLNAGVGIGASAVVTAVSTDGATATVSVKSSGTTTVTATLSSHFNAGDVGATLSGNANIPAGTKIQFVISGTLAEIDHAASAAGTAVATTVTPVGQVHNVTGLSSTATNATINATAGTFNSGDVGKTIDSTCTFASSTITAVAVDGSSATVLPGAKTTCGSFAARIGSPVASPTAILAASGPAGPYPGGRLVYNVLDNTSPSYTQARALVGYLDAPSGAKSNLCNSGHDTSNGGADDLISDNGFLPLPPHTSDGGNTNVSCFKF